METYQPRQAIRSIVALTLGALLVSPSAEAAQLKPETLDAWAAYISATEHRIEREHASNAGFLVQDFDDDAEGGRTAVRRGEVPVRRMETRQDDGSKIKVRKGAIHHWRGCSGCTAGRSRSTTMVSIFGCSSSPPTAMWS